MEDRSAQKHNERPATQEHDGIIEALGLSQLKVLPMQTRIERTGRENPGLSPEELELIQRIERGISTAIDALVNDAWQESSGFKLDLLALTSQLADFFRLTEENIRLDAAVRISSTGTNKMYRWWSHAIGKVRDHLQKANRNDGNKESLSPDGEVPEAARLHPEYILEVVKEFSALFEDSTRRKGEEEWDIRRPRLRLTDSIRSVFRKGGKPILGKIRNEISDSKNKRKDLRREIDIKKATINRVLQEAMIAALT